MSGGKLVIDISKYNWNLTDTQWDTFGKILDGVIIRLSYGKTIDSKAQDHIDQCKRVGLPYSSYVWVDPTSDFQGQLNTVIEARKRFNPTSIFLDFEQYWTDWAAYMSGDFATAYATRLTPEQIDSYYKKFFIAAKQYCNSTIGCYSSYYFMKDYCKPMFDWIPFNNYWRAGYPINENHYEPEEVRVLANTIDLTGCIARQFSDGLDVTGLPPKLDWNVFSKDGFDLMFGGEPMPAVGRELNMVGVSQIGTGANDHHNDCGLACCSMDTLAAKDIFVQVDEWYKMDGWGAPSTDIGTTAYQLQRALALFDIRSKTGSLLTIENIKNYINGALPIIPLVDYGVLSNAGLTYYKGNFLHWFVVMGYDNDNIIALDPYRPYEVGLKIKIPNSIFLSSYRGSYLALVDSIEGGTSPVAHNGTVITASLNVRKTAPVNGVLGNKVGALTLSNRVTIDRNTITSDNWGNVTASNNATNPIGWVSMDYIKLDVFVPPVPPVGEDTKAARLDEIARMEAYLTKRKTEI